MRVRLICWNAEEKAARAKELTERGHVVDATAFRSSGIVSQFRDSPTDVVIIDLDRLPSHGREVGVSMRQSKSTRMIPVVFAGGDAMKTERIRAELPDAVYSSWTRIERALNTAVRTMPAEPVRPPAHMERYAGTSLAQKLGFKDGTRAVLTGAPENFEELLSGLPETASLTRRRAKQYDLLLWFVRTRSELETELPYVEANLPVDASLWVIYPKGSGRLPRDFNETQVREAGLGSGLVDYKICSVSADWSGMKFARRKN